MKPNLLNLHNHKLWAIIPAAGSGSRFSKQELKQYQVIQGKTVLEHTVQRLNQLPLSGYVLAVSAQDNIVKQIDLPKSERAHYCLGGAERVNSVLNALNYLSTFADENDWVLVHDAARPCVSLQNLNALVHQAVEGDISAILAIPVRDTLKLVLDQNTKTIEKTVNRDQLWQAQTPQISKLGLLKKAIEEALQQGVNITDEASALECMNEQVRIVAGRSDNIKITYPEDLILAQMIMQSQNG